ncbi:MAG TPA: TIGR03808 family TAT-translocated repetitive protein [Devosiaceae bacterium]|jgi:uncharacterized secreted repeat protein (TIGR03808 family)
MAVPSLHRRHLLLGAGALGLAAAIRPAIAAPLKPNAATDQTAALQAAIDDAAKHKTPLVLPAGTFHTGTLKLPDHLQLQGQPGATILAATGSDPILTADGAASLTLTGLTFTGIGTSTDRPDGGLVDLKACTGLTLTACSFNAAPGNALTISGSDGLIENCSFANATQAAIFSLDNTGLSILANRIADCHNGGILVWRSETGVDGTIVTGNRIARIGWTDGGNGQNGNGINIYRADAVIVSGNHVADCAFSGVRANTTRNTQITGNTCLNSGETALYSEFAFSGSVIANNIVDGATVGISIANLDNDGHLATCSGNIIRNIAPRSTVNPDTTPSGIAAEADVAITGNVIEGVPGPAISAGWGPYLRNVLVSSNVISDADIGIAVSVAEGAGTAQVTGNIIAAHEAAIVGMAWTETVTRDLASDVARYPSLTISGNSVAPA